MINFFCPSKRGLLSTAFLMLAALMPQTAPAQTIDPNAPDTVILSSRDGTISIQGSYVGFENGAFIVNTGRMGIMRVDANRVNCSGAACMLALDAAQGNEPAPVAPASVEAAPVEPAPVEPAPVEPAPVEPAPVVAAEPTPEPTPVAATPPVAEPEPVPVADLRFGIHGSRSVGATLIPSLLRGYAAHVGATYEIIETDDAANRIVRLTNPDGSLRAEIDLKTPGSGAAIPALIDGLADIGLTDRPLNAGDMEKLTAAGLPDLRNGPNEIVLGLDGIVMIAHPDNPVRDLSSEDIARIYSGEITNWIELGGGDLPISVQSYVVTQGDREVMLNGLVRPTGRDEMELENRWKTYQELVDAVMADRGSIGYVGRWLARSNNVKLITIREVCGLHSEPSDFRIKIEGYSLSRRLFAFKLPGDIHPEARAFLDWTQTRDAQPYIKAAHFVDRDLERMRLEDMGMALIHTAAVEPDFSGRQYSDMMRELRGADRLSLSFRFQSGSSTLDSESVKNVQELARLIEAGDYAGQEVLLVGFADSIGDRDRNTALAKSRADEVRDILLEVLPAEVAKTAKLVPLSYGELMPLSCNEDEVGRERNRRVEVWLRLPNSRSTLR